MDKCYTVKITILGPLTYTDEQGKTTLFGVVSGMGTIGGDNCKTRGLFSRVAEPRVLKWIRNVTGKN